MRRWLLCFLLAVFVTGLVCASAGADKITVVQAYPAGFVAAPFIYSGVTYVPLRSVASVVGAALLWDSVRNRAALTFNGREFGLVIGSPTVYIGPQVVVLPSPPIIVGGVIFVPEVFVQRELRVPIERGRGFIKIKGREGWHEMRFHAAPPARYISGWRGKGGAAPRAGRMGKPGRGPAARGREPGRVPFQVGPGRGTGGGKPEEYGPGRGRGKRGEGRGKGRGKG